MMPESTAFARNETSALAGRTVRGAQTHVLHSMRKQNGVALMIVILVFALVSILAVGMYNRQSLFVQRSANQLAQAQAYQYALASEIYGRRLLKADWDDDKEKNEFGTIIMPITFISKPRMADFASPLS